MSLEVSEVTIREICEPFETSNQNVKSWCDWMRNFHTKSDTNVDVVEENIVLNNAQKVAILGARRVFKAMCVDLISSLSSNPDYNAVLQTTLQFVLYIEGSMMPLHIILEKFLKNTKKSLVVETLTLEPGTNIVSNPSATYEKLKDFIETTFTATNCLYNNVTDQGLTDDRFKLLKELDIDVQKVTVNFSNWKTIVINGLMTRLNYGILGRVEITRKKLTLDRVESFLNIHDFTSLTSSEVRKMLEVFHSHIFNYILSEKNPKLKNVKAVGRKTLEPKQIKMILSGVNYAGVHPLISGPIEAKMRKNLTKLLNDVELENKFVPELAHVVVDTFQKARLHQGHRVGIIAAMAVGEDASQAGLRSFHNAGVTGATGFDRVKEVTDNPNIDKVRNGFTIIAIEGKPDAIQAQLYAHLIEETRVSDICQIVVGRTLPTVPEISTEFGETPVFVAEAGGWQERYIALSRFLTTPDQKQKDMHRPKFDRPNWILRLRCDKSKMYQKRITPTTIAQIIENAFSDMRAIPSDFATGLIDIYINTSGIGKNFGISDEYAKLTMQSIPILSGKIIQGVYGFSKTVIEKFDITIFISKIYKIDENRHHVIFNSHDVKINGVPKEDLLIFLRNKVTPTGVITELPDMTFEVTGFEGDLRARILAPEVVRLVDFVDSRQENDSNFTVKLNKHKLLSEEDISVLELSQFFEKQNELKTFASIDIKFNRNDFSVSLSRSVDFTPKVLAEEFQRFGISDQVSFGDDSIVYDNVRADADYERFQIALRGYNSNISSKVDRKAKRITLTLHPMSVSGAWNLLEAIQDCSTTIYTTFTARKRQRLGERYRIIAKGIGIENLAQVEFVNIYATHSSVSREHYKYFDIECARDYINSELVLNVGGDIGDRHLGLISDAMCYMGSPIKLKLSGKRATNSGPLSTAYVQETLKLLMDSAAGYQTDDLNSAVGMTLIGDFNRGEYGHNDNTVELEKTESAIDLLMSSTVTTRKVVKPKAKPEQKPTIVTTNRLRDLLKDE